MICFLWVHVELPVLFLKGGWERGMNREIGRGRERRER